ncbi:hypothetical protein B0H19DRAFT_1307962 [Mycena capillaripes]|nr:hypothetical protein B0H19DRAFT_1307962 [Mycena capillaripes]
MPILPLTFFTGQLALSNAGLLKYPTSSQDAVRDFVPSAPFMSPPEKTSTQIASTQMNPIHETAPNDRMSADNYAVSQTVLPIARAAGTGFGGGANPFHGFPGITLSSPLSTSPSSSSPVSPSQPTSLPPTLPPSPTPTRPPPPLPPQSSPHPPPTPTPKLSSLPAPVTSASNQSSGTSELSQPTNRQSSPIQIVDSIILGSTASAGLPSASSHTTNTSPGNTISSSPSTGSKHTSVLVGVLIPLLILLLVVAIIIHRRRRRRCRHRRRRPHRVFDAQSTDVATSETLRDATSNKRDALQGRNNPDVQVAPSEKNSAPQSEPSFTQTDPYETTTPRNEYSLSRAPFVSRAPTFISGDWPETPLPRYTVLYPTTA